MANGGDELVNGEWGRGGGSGGLDIVPSDSNGKLG